MTGVPGTPDPAGAERSHPAPAGTAVRRTRLDAESDLAGTAIEMQQLLGAAAGWRAELDARSPEIEEHRTLPADIVARLRQAGLFAMALPAHLGGLGLSPAAILPVIEELSSANGSVGWTVMVGQSCGYLDWLTAGAAQAIVAKTPWPIIAGSTAPLGVARQATDGRAGYLLKGRWPFSTGCLHADWLIGAFLAPEAAREKGDVRIPFFPRSEALIHDTWDAYGLSGTGSHDIEVNDLFLPGARIIEPFGEPSDAQGLPHRLSFFTFSVAMMAGYPLGVARRAIDEARCILLTEPGDPYRRVTADDPIAWTTYLDAQAALDAARCLVTTAMEQACRQAGQAGHAEIGSRVRLDYAVRYAFRSARRIVDKLLALNRPADPAHPLQRCHRDIYAGAQHAGVGQDTAYRLGATLLGRQVDPAHV